MILAGDIGGTSTRLALFDVAGGKLQPIVQQKYPSRDHASLDEIVLGFVAAQKDAITRPIRYAGFGIAGPVRNRKVQASNLPWIVDAAKLSDELSIPHVFLLNDLESNAHGIPELGPNDFVTLNEGQDDHSGNAAIISAGTGLGEAGIYYDGKELHPFACEGGHSDFSPQDDLETDLVLYLRKRFAQSSNDHVSWERVLSGPGLRNIYDFLRDTGRGTETPELAAAMKGNDASAVISKAGLEGSCGICVQALNLFVSFYGSEAGNLALKIMSTRAVYVGGGIAPKIISKLKEPIFMTAFLAKGRMHSVMQAMPVHVIMNDQTALLGSARFAAVKARLLPPWGA